MLEGLEVDAAKMRANLDMTNGLVVSEAVMMGLGRYIGREHAHDLVYDICREAVRQNRPLRDMLAANDEITRHVSRDATCSMVRPGKLPWPGRRHGGPRAGAREVMSSHYETGAC